MATQFNGQGGGEARSVAMEAEAVRLYTVVTGHGVTLRLFGSTAVRLHCPRFKYLLDRGRRVPKDLDGVIRREDRERLGRVLRDEGWVSDHGVEAWTEGERLLFGRTSDGLTLDFSAGPLRFCQTLDVDRRLEADAPTIPVADLVLSKLQIVSITASDLQDLIVLMLEHRLGEDDGDHINWPYVAAIVGRSWPWYHSVECGLSAVVEFAQGWRVLSDEERRKVGEAITELRERMTRMRKTVCWQLRAVIGDRIRWYTSVADQT